MRYLSSIVVVCVVITAGESAFIGDAFAANSGNATNSASQSSGSGQDKHKQGKKEKRNKKTKHAADDHGDGLHTYFHSENRDIIRTYYGDQMAHGHCPPGLAKKNNGCLPPGQAKKWRIGQPLGHYVVYHDLPQELLDKLAHTPEGYKLIRVGADILKIAIGTRLVLEAVEDLADLL